MLTQASVAVVRLYGMAVSPYLPTSCRYQPTCSNYSLEVLKRHGFVKGWWLTARRLGRCHPFGGSGYDPAPQ